MRLSASRCCKESNLIYRCELEPMIDNKKCPIFPTSVPCVERKASEKTEHFKLVYDRYYKSSITIFQLNYT